MNLFLRLNTTPIVEVSADNIFLVTSTIRPGQHPLSYTDIRSVFSPRERLIQTLSTIDSVREKVPDAAIVLLENSPLTEDETVLLQSSGARLVLYSGEREAVKWRDCPFKGAGELYLLMQALKWLKQLRYQRLFKLSGRYCLNDRFHLSRFPQDRFGIYSDGTSFSTRLYSVPKSLEQLYGKQLKTTFRKALKGSSIESHIMEGVPESKIALLPFLGVTGQVAVTGDYILE